MTVLLLAQDRDRSPPLLMILVLMSPLPANVQGCLMAVEMEAAVAALLPPVTPVLTMEMEAAVAALLHPVTPVQTMEMEAAVAAHLPPVTPVQTMEMVADLLPPVTSLI